MMKTIDFSIRDEILKVESLKKEILEEKQGNPLMDEFMQHVLQSKGKQVRPKLTLLCASLFGKPNRSTYLACILIDVLHQATLLHDDVVDNATERRGELAANVLFGNKSSVLMGDYLLSKMIAFCSSEKEYELLDVLSKSLVNLSKGELLQLSDLEANKIDLDRLIGVAQLKTASLMTACSVSGANSTNASEIDKQIMATFAENIGVAFQIKDDILDYFDTNKEKFKDLKEGKVNIPFILALDEADLHDKNQILQTFKKEVLLEDDLDRIKGFITYYNGLQRAEELQMDYLNQAITMIEHYEGAEALIDFTKKLGARVI